ncbi:MAG: phosphate transporter permease subunit PstC [Verrucomicrobiota bacterium]
MAWDMQKLIRSFFASNASVTIIVLLLIMVFLMREGAGFLGTYKHELEIYRKAGLELCDLVDRPLAQHQDLSSKLRRAVTTSIDPLIQSTRARRDAAFYIKREIEQSTTLPREALTQALEKTPALDPAKLDQLRRQVASETAAAAATAAISNLFSAEEVARLRREMSLLSPEVTEMPSFLTELSAAFRVMDKEAKQKYTQLIEASDLFEEAPDSLRAMLSELKEDVLFTKEAAMEYFTLEEGRQKLLKAAEVATDLKEKADLLAEAEASKTEEPNYQENLAPVLERREELQEHITQYADSITEALKTLPKTGDVPEATKLLAEVHEHMPLHVQAMRKSLTEIKEWQAEKPVSIITVVGAFFFGSAWLTNSSWQDFFGFVPLLAGSVVIALIAIVIATPLSVAAAIYTNQFASDREKEFIKPVIEFIQAIPSVVLGFIGISLLGDLIKDMSEIPWLSGLPGFPIQERLNMFNAGCLLALMAIPTMFSLAEDALNNVPQAYIDASDALGATKLQTVFRVIVPAALSGIAAAVLLGLGRVIGETMVVLLVAGNRIAIPDFGVGPGFIFQPAHTLTGIIAQELGEVSRGSAHWQALFMVGIVLFAISLLVNGCARAVVRRFETPKA